MLSLTSSWVTRTIPARINYSGTWLTTRALGYWLPKYTTTWFLHRLWLTPVMSRSRLYIPTNPPIQCLDSSQSPHLTSDFMASDYPDYPSHPDYPTFTFWIMVGINGQADNVPHHQNPHSIYTFQKSKIDRPSFQKAAISVWYTFIGGNEQLRIFFPYSSTPSPHVLQRVEFIKDRIPLPVHPKGHVSAGVKYPQMAAGLPKC